MNVDLNSKRIYIVRHGETEYNRQGMVQGRGIDAPLNATGKAQAEAFYEAYRDHPFDKIYVSKLKRTAESVSKFIDKGIPIEKLSGLDEISWGTQEGVKFSEKAKTEYEDAISDWKKGNLEINVAGGESPIQVMDRQKEAFDHILNQPAEQEILICMHGRAIRILVSWLLNYDLRYMDEFPHANLGLYLLTYNGHFFQVLKRNDTSHLKNLRELV